MRFLLFIPIWCYSQLPIGTSTPVSFQAHMNVIHVYSDTTYQTVQRILLVVYYDSILLVVDRPICFYQCKLYSSVPGEVRDHTYQCIYDNAYWYIRYVVRHGFTLFINSRNKFPNYSLSTYEINRH